MAAEDNIVISPKTLTSILGAYAKGARWEEALRILGEGRPSLQEAFVSQQAFDGGVMGAKERKEWDDLVPAYTLAMVACRAADRHDEGLQILSMVEEDGGRADEELLRLALKCCAKTSPVAAPVLRPVLNNFGAERRGGGSSGGGDEACEMEEDGAIATVDGATIADCVLKEMSFQGITCSVECLTDVAQVRYESFCFLELILSY